MLIGFPIKIVAHLMYYRSTSLETSPSWLFLPQYDSSRTVNECRSELVILRHASAILTIYWLT